MYNNTVSYIPDFATNYRWCKEENKYTAVDCDLLFFLNLSLHIGDKLSSKLNYAVEDHI